MQPRMINCKMNNRANRSKGEKNMDPFISFMASRNGRIVRIVVGLALVVWGFFGIDNVTTGTIVLIVGLVPLAAGIFDFCVLAPLFGAPLSGSKIRAGK
jgi:hypothetical protein